MKKAKNSAACRSGSRYNSATRAGSPTNAVSVNNRKCTPRNASTAGILFTRSVMNTPVANRAASATIGSSGNAPHQLWPVSKAK